MPSYDRYGFAFFPDLLLAGTSLGQHRLRSCEAWNATATKSKPSAYEETIVSLCRDQAFYEYYDPTTGFGHGSDLFSWTAALAWDVVLEKQTSEK